MLDAKKQEEEGKGSRGGKGEPETIISDYMQKKDDLEFRTLQELNQQMTNWVETVQSQNYAEGDRSQLDEADQELWDKYGLSETELDDSDSDFLDEKLQGYKAKLKKRKMRGAEEDGSSSDSDDSDSEESKAGGRSGKPTKK